MNKVDFKNESEVKEYIQNLGSEYSYQCYREKSAEGCYRLGDFFSAVKGDFTKAVEAYKNSCEEYAFGQACNKAATFYLHGKGVTKSTDEAYRLFEKGCAAGSTDACHGAGILLHQVGLGSENTKDSPKAANYLQRSCNEGHIPSCFYLSSMYIQGAQGIDKDMAKAHKLSLKCCEANNMYACANISRMYLCGEGVAKDVTLSKQYRTKAENLQHKLKEEIKQLKFGE